MATTRKSRKAELRDDAELVARIRKSIETERLVTCLAKYAYGDNDMTSSQVTAATVLLAKVLPNLGTVQLAETDQGNAGKPLQELRWAKSDAEATPDPSR